MSQNRMTRIGGITAIGGGAMMLWLAASTAPTAIAAPPGDAGGSQKAPPKADKNVKIAPPPKPIATSFEPGMSYADLNRVRCKGAGSPLKILRKGKNNLQK